MKFVSLFSGCGGLDIGLERAGHECVCQVEIDERPHSVLRKVWPNVPRIKDVRDADRRTLPAGFDMLVGGFPCTNLSVAGGREGLAGDASGLWFQMHRIAIECRPRVLIIENVPGLFSSADGKDFAIVLGGLLGLPVGVPDGGWRGSGVAKGTIYHVAWRVLDSQFFGVAQQRRRVFIAGCLRGSGISPVEILFEPEGVRRDYQTCSQARKETAGSSGDSTSRSRLWGGEVSSTLQSRFNGAEQAFRLVGTVTPASGGADENDAQASRLVAGPLKSQGMGGYNTDTFPYVSAADIAPTMNTHLGDKQGLENQHIDSGGGISLPALCQTVNSKWAKGTGGPAGDECQNLIPTKI